MKPRDYKLSRLRGETSDLQRKLAQPSVVGSTEQAIERRVGAAGTLGRNINVTVREGEVKVEIKVPDHAAVPEDRVIEGTVSDPNTAVYLLVMPADSTEYRVTSQARVTADGSWTATLPVSGRIGQTGAKTFKIVAVARQKTDLELGTGLQAVPPASGVSSPVNLIQGGVER